MSANSLQTPHTHNVKADFPHPLVIIGPHLLRPMLGVVAHARSNFSPGMVLSTVHFVTLSFGMIFELFKTDVASKRKHPDVARFGVRHRLPVDCDILEYDMLDCPVRIVSADPRRIGAVPGAGNILVADMLDPFARHRIVLRVVEHADIEQLSELERFYPDIPVGHIPDRIVIAGS